MLLIVSIILLPEFQILANDSSDELIYDLSEEELIENDYILYFVNAGTVTPDTVDGNDKMGLYASKTDQTYGEDEVTDKHWGLVTETTESSGNSSDKFRSLRYYSGDSSLPDKGIEYLFDLPEGKYDITFGFMNPWSGRDVNILINGENVSGDIHLEQNQEYELIYRQQSVTEGKMSVKIQGPSSGELHQHNDPLINFIIIRSNVLIPIAELEEVIAIAVDETEKIDSYTTSSIERLIAEINEGETIVKAVNDNGEDPTTVEFQDKIHNAIHNINLAINNLEARDEIGIGVSPFVRSESDQVVTNVNIYWSEVKDADHYVLYRSDDLDEQYQEIYHGSALMNGDYNLNVNRTYKYKIRAIEKDGRYVESKPISFKPFVVPNDVGYFHNNEEGGFQGTLGPSGIKHEGIYYSYRQVNDSDGFLQIEQHISDNGLDWEFDKVVLDRNSHPDLEESKLESGTVQLNPNTGDIVAWYHYENNVDYSLARLAVASGKPGEVWDYHGSFRPNGNESRDKAYFIDDDGTGYIMSSANMNADFIMYRLTPDHLEIEEEMMTLFEGQHREGPGISKHDGHYYIFNSGAAGWYPTQATYASAPSMEGPWTELRLIGNKNTFSGQSGHTNIVSGTETTTHIMNAYRWQHGWAEQPGGARDRWFPISMHNGYAFYDYYEKLFASGSTGLVYGLQADTLLSQGKPAFAESEAEGSEAKFANDGNYQTSWVAENSDWPSWWMVDLEDIYLLTNIQISWFLFNGSEAVHLYEIETSVDGENFDVAFDGTNNKNYGFTSDPLNVEARYVRIKMLDANLHNNPNNWYTPQLSQVKVFGVVDDEIETEIVVNENETNIVYPEQKVIVKDTDVSIVMPNDLPIGTKATIHLNKTTEATTEDGYLLTKAGDIVTIDFTFPENAQNYEGEYILELGYQDQSDDIAIFYFDETTEYWKYIGGTLNSDRQTIEQVVKDFSTYGVFELPPEEDMISDLEAKIEEILKRIEALRDLGTEVTELERLIEELRGEIERLNPDSVDDEALLAELLDRLVKLEEKIESQEQKFLEREERDEYESENNNSDTKADEYESENNNSDTKASEIDEPKNTRDDLLPNTATSIFNYLVIGLLLVVIGGLFVIYVKRRQERD